MTTKRIFPINSKNFSEITVKSADIEDNLYVRNDSTILDNLLVKGNLGVEDNLEVFGHVGLNRAANVNMGLAGAWEVDSGWATTSHGISTALTIDGLSSKSVYSNVNALYGLTTFSPSSIKGDFGTIRGLFAAASLGSNERYTYLLKMNGVLSGVQFVGNDSTVHTAVHYDTFSYFSASDFKLTGEQIGLRINDLPSVETPASWAIWTGKDPIRFGGDTTMKRKIYVEDHGTTYNGLTTDFTTQGIVFKVVKGLIVEGRHHSS